MFLKIVHNNLEFLAYIHLEFREYNLKIDWTTKFFWQFFGSKSATL